MAFEPLSTPPPSGLPIWFLALLGLAALVGMAGLATTVAGMKQPPARRTRYFAVGLGLSVLGAGLFLAMLGTA
jgi:hypothetical protein